MEMDRQTIMAICFAILGMIVLGGFYFGAPATREEARPLYAQDDIRAKFQQEDAKKPKKKKTAAKKPKVEPQRTTHASSGDGDSDGESHEEPSVFDHEPQEEPPLD